MEENKSNSKIFLQILALSATIFTIVSIPYFIKFHSSIFSANSQDWGAFGSLIAGIVGVINLSVFIILTIHISRLSNKSSERQIMVQKKTLISEFRQKELNKLDDQLNKAIVFTGYEKTGELVNIYSQTSIFLTNFQNQQKFLFPTLTENFIKSRINVLLENYDIISNLIDKYHEKGVMLPKNKMILEQALAMIITMKSELIEELQKFILHEIEK